MIRKGKQTTNKRRIQNVKRSTVTELVVNISDDMKSYSGHLFRSDYQHKVEKDIFSNLPIDQCAVVMDFSENISLDSQDQIESAHCTTMQITLHPIYIVRHDKASTEAAPVLKKEFLIIISDKFSSQCLHSICTHKKVQVGKDQEKAQSEKDSHSKNRGGKKPNQQSGTYTMKHIVSRMSSYFPNRWPLSYLNLTKNMKTYIRRQQHKKFSNTKT